MMMGVSCILVQVLEMGFIGKAPPTLPRSRLPFRSRWCLPVSPGDKHWYFVGDHAALARNPTQSNGDVQRLGAPGLSGDMCYVGFGLCWWAIDPIFLALGANEAMLPLIHNYLDIYLGSIFFTIAMILGSIMPANGSARSPA